MLLRKHVAAVTMVFCLSLGVSSFSFAQDASNPEEVRGSLVQRVVGNVSAPSAPSAHMPVEPTAETTVPTATEMPVQPAAETPAPTPPASEVPPAVQETPLPTGMPQEAVAPSATEVPAAEKLKAEWIWGEVVSVDKEKRQLVVKHLSQETYEDIETTIRLDDATMLENAGDLSEIKAGDHLTLDYGITGNENVAELIVVERNEMPMGEEAGGEAAIEEPLVAPPVGQETTPGNLKTEETGQEKPPADPVL